MIRGKWAEKKTPGPKRGKGRALFKMAMGCEGSTRATLTHKGVARECLIQLLPAPAVPCMAMK